MPRQLGQPRSTMKKPCWVRILPIPPQVLQWLVQRSSPVQPRPSHTSHCAERLDGDRPLDAGERFLEAELDIVAKVGAARRVLTNCAALVHELAEDGRENVGETIDSGIGEWVAAAAILEGRMPEAVVSRALLRILQHVIGLVDRLEVRLAFLAAILAVGMVFLGEASIGGLDRRVVSSSLHAQQLVIVLLDHHPSPLRLQETAPPL